MQGVYHAEIMVFHRTSKATGEISPVEMCMYCFLGKHPMFISPLLPCKLHCSFLICLIWVFTPVLFGCCQNCWFRTKFFSHCGFEYTCHITSQIFLPSTFCSFWISIPFLFFPCSCIIISLTWLFGNLMLGFWDLLPFPMGRPFPP